MAKQNNNEEKVRLSLYIKKDHEGLVNIISKITGESKLEVCNTLFLNGIDTLLCTASTNLKNVNFEGLKNWVHRFQLDNEISKILILYKNQKEVKDK